MTYHVASPIGALGMSRGRGVGTTYSVPTPSSITTAAQADLDTSTEELDKKKKMVKYAAIGLGVLVVGGGIMIAKHK